MCFFTWDICPKHFVCVKQEQSIFWGCGLACCVLGGRKVRQGLLAWQRWLLLPLIKTELALLCRAIIEQLPPAHRSEHSSLGCSYTTLLWCFVLWVDQPLSQSVATHESAAIWWWLNILVWLIFTITPRELLGPRQTPRVLWRPLSLILQRLSEGRRLHLKHDVVKLGGRSGSWPGTLLSFGLDKSLFECLEVWVNRLGIRAKGQTRPKESFRDNSPAAGPRWGDQGPETRRLKQQWEDKHTLTNI